jgi:hypothetical protein
MPAINVGWISRPWGAPTGGRPMVCRSGPCPRSMLGGNRAHGALLQVYVRESVGAGHARDQRWVEFAPMGRSYRCTSESL